jgi:hypothetical protein
MAGRGAARSRPQKNAPTSSGGPQAHKSETRISAIADRALKHKQENKAPDLIHAGMAG